MRSSSRSCRTATISGSVSRVAGAALVMLPDRDRGEAGADYTTLVPGVPKSTFADRCAAGGTGCRLAKRRRMR